MTTTPTQRGARVSVQDPATGQWKDLGHAISDVRMTAEGEQLQTRFLERQQVTPAGLTAWQDVKLRWALGAGLLLAKWVMRYGG